MVRLFEEFSPDDIYENEIQDIDLDGWSLARIHDKYHNKIMNGEAIDPDAIKVMYNGYINFFNTIYHNCIYLYKRCVYSYLLYKYSNNRGEYDRYNEAKLDLFLFLTLDDTDKGMNILISRLISNKNKMYKDVLNYYSCSNDQEIKDVIHSHNELFDNIPDELTIESILRNKHIMED